MKNNEYTMFRKSRPYGYNPPDVEKAIEQYEAALSQINSKLIESRQIIQQQKEKIERLQSELREMHLQMSNLELPDVDEAIEHYVLDDFKNYNNPEIRDFPEPNIIKDETTNIKLNKNQDQYNNIIIGENMDSNGNNDDEDDSFIIIQ